MMLFDKKIIVKNQQVFLPILKEKEVELWVKREDKIHKLVSGNKFRKLKYNIKEAKRLGKKRILTFGGAYSNHIVATAVAANLSGLQSVGVIRGNELANNKKLFEENETLKIANEKGMLLKFISREDFRRKKESNFIESLKIKFEDFYLIPEGGTNELAIKGCEEILTPKDEKFSYICTSAGTGGTTAGLINASKKHQTVMSFSALKGDFLSKEINKMSSKNNWNLQTNYHFGGYAKYNEELIAFINKFYKQTRIPIDSVYTGKMMYGIIDLVKKGYFKPKTKILAIHTGGLQGITGINKILIKKNLETIQVK